MADARSLLCFVAALSCAARAPTARPATRPPPCCAVVDPILEWMIACESGVPNDTDRGRIRSPARPRPYSRAPVMVASIHDQIIVAQGEWLRLYRFPGVQPPAEYRAPTRILSLATANNAAFFVCDDGSLWSTYLDADLRWATPRRHLPDSRCHAVRSSDNGLSVVVETRDGQLLHGAFVTDGEPRCFVFRDTLEWTTDARVRSTGPARTLDELLCGEGRWPLAISDVERRRICDFGELRGPVVSLTPPRSLSFLRLSLRVVRPLDVSVFRFSREEGLTAVVVPLRAVSVPSTARWSRWRFCVSQGSDTLACYGYDFLRRTIEWRHVRDVRVLHGAVTFVVDRDDTICGIDTSLALRCWSVAE